MIKIEKKTVLKLGQKQLTIIMEDEKSKVSYTFKKLTMENCSMARYFPGPHFMAPTLEKMFHNPLEKPVTNIKLELVASKMTTKRILKRTTKKNRFKRRMDNKDKRKTRGSKK
ncbi:MAG TPA: hypothetical protein ENH95_02860 [Nitrosopumilus sp.]|nr:hypothetical protein [Nitrosopumilus sp.]